MAEEMLVFEGAYAKVRCCVRGLRGAARGGMDALMG
jgi:hypothetical protein